MTLRSNSKKQFDYSRPLLKESCLEAFLRLDSVDGAEYFYADGGKVGTRRREALQEVIKKPEASAIEADKGKSNIAIPSVNKIDDASKDAEAHLKKFQSEENYIRYSLVKIYPHPEAYEATDYDLEFLKELNLNSSGKLKTGSDQITREDFERMIEIWDAETDKDEPISLQRAQAAIEKVFDVNLYKDHVSEIHVYWKGRREAFKRPLVRKYWRTVNRDETNPNIVFRAREKQKIETRRHKKGNTTENLEKMKGVKHELEMAKTLLANLCLREMIKYELNGLSISKFDLTVQEKIEGGGASSNISHYKEKFENEERLKKRNQLKEFNKVAQQFISQPKEELDTTASKIGATINNPVMKNVRSAEEYNFKIARFIANVAMKADQKHITLDRLDDPQPMPLPMPLPLPLPLPQPNPIIDPIGPPVIVKTTASEEKIKNILKYKIRRRIGRQGRIIIDKIPVTYEEAQFDQVNEKANDLFSTRKIVRLDEFGTGLNVIYDQKYSRMEDIYPFADSDDDKDLTEFTKTLKRTSFGFKNFQKQRRSSTIFAAE